MISKSEHERNILVGKVRYMELKAICNDICGFQYAIIKGEPLSILLYGEEGRRISSDIDFLVERSNVSRLEEILVKHGFHTSDSASKRVNRVLSMSGSHQIASYCKKVLGIDIVIDINFDVFWGEYTGRRIDTTFLLNNVKKITAYGVDVFTLNSVFSCIQLVLHHYKEMNSLYHLLNGKGITYKKMQDIHDMFKKIQNDEELTRDLVNTVYEYKLEEFFYYILIYTKEIYPESDHLMKFITLFHTERGEKSIDEYGLDESEKHKWNLPIIERFSPEITVNFVKGNLSEKEKKKIEREKNIFG